MPVSIVMPAYDCGRFIERSIASVRAQTHGDWELLVVDDGSRDDTVERIGRIVREDPRVRLTTLPEHRGAAAARNLATTLARGRYLAFLDADDVWHPRKLETQLSFMRRTGASFSCTAFGVIDERGALLPGVVRPPSVATYDDLLRSCTVGCLTAMYDVQAVGKVPAAALERRQDYTVWLRILQGGHVCHGIDDVLAWYRRRRDSLSSNKLKAAGAQWAVYRSVQRLPLPLALRCFASYAVRGVLKPHVLQSVRRWRGKRLPRGGTS